MTTKEFADNVAANAWNWNVWEFARRAKLADPDNGTDGEHTKKQWRLFNQLHNAMQALDPGVLEVIGSKEGREAAMSGS